MGNYSPPCCKMSLEELTHQFTHSTSKRRASVVYGSGKGGLFTPSDFISRKDSGGTIEFSLNRRSGSIEEDETTPLVLSSSVVQKNQMRRKSVVARELIEQEREFLKDSHIDITAEQDEDGVMKSFEEAIASKKILDTTFAIEIKALFKASVPLVATFLLESSLATVSVFSVGHLGATQLAAVSLGSMLANITGYATIQGISTALDTLCPQAFGAKKYVLVGSYLQKCIALISTVMLPILIGWVFFGEFFVSLVIRDAKTVAFASTYLRYVAPGIPAYILFECGKRFLQAQGIYHISTYVLLFAAPSNLIMNILLVKQLGYIGAPIAVAINYWLMATGLYVLTRYFITPESTPSGLHPLVCWDVLDIRGAFKDWNSLLYLAIPGLIMLEAEFLAFEILTLMASYLGTIPLAAQSIGTTMAALTYQVPFAVGIAASSRIANFLGAGLGQAAKKATQVTEVFGLCVSLVNFLFLSVFRTEIANLFTDDPDVIATVKDVMWLIALMQVSDAMNANSAGCLRGQGQTKIGGIVNLISYYLIGIPLSVYLTFYSKISGTLHGLWIGCFVALTIIGVVQSYYALSADFDKLCDDARKRTSENVASIA